MHELLNVMERQQIRSDFVRGILDDATSHALPSNGMIDIPSRLNIVFPKDQKKQHLGFITYKKLFVKIKT